MGRLSVVTLLLLDVMVVGATAISSSGMRCEYDGEIYENGDNITQADPCKTCKCTRENGVVCTHPSCAPVQCVNPVKGKNECCPICPGGPNCWYGKRKIKVGQVYTPQPNVQCACPDHYEPLACCRKLPKSRTYLRRKLRKQGGYVNPILKAYIEKYLRNK